MTNIAHFSLPNSIPISSLKTRIVCTNESNHFSLQLYCHFLTYTLIIIIIIIIIIVVVVVANTQKTTLENTVEIEPQPATLDFKNLSQYSSCPK